MAHKASPTEAQDISTEKKLDELYELTRDMETAMFTTRRSDGRMVSRAMAVQGPAAGADFWFVTSSDSDKIDELEFDPQVNLAFYRDRTREWVSVSGTARTSRDESTIRELYQPSWKAWFADEGGERDGGPGDPRIVLVGVEAESAVYFKVNKPRPLVLFEVARAMVTGDPPNVGATRELGERVFDANRGSNDATAADWRSGVIETDVPDRRR
ncbi:MAG: pyridoxamine 5'-phosphate oxidase family protein [Gemmatimonadota bacterium]